MSIKRTTAGFLLLLTILPSAAFAAENVNDSCLEQIYNQMAHEERMYRSVLFGQKKSEDLPSGSVRFDKESNTWLKTEDNTWKSLDPGFEGTTWSDTLMNDQADIEVRRGIFEIRKTPTSDLIPPLVQSLRALQCRLRAVCQLAADSQSVEEGNTDPLKINTDGCKEFEMKPLSACTATTIAGVGPGTCSTAVIAVMEREQKLLQMVVAYDAAYRTLAQFSGIFEGFLADFRFPLLQPLWQMIRTLGALDNLPCFNGQCDE